MAMRASVQEQFYAGLSNIDLGEQRVEFPRGIVLQATFAHLMSPMVMAFAKPEKEGQPHPGPWKSARGGFGQDISAQLFVPNEAGSSFGERLQMAATILFLIRLWSSPAVTMPALANMAFSDVKHAPDAEAHILPLEHQPRHFELYPADDTKVAASLTWVVDHFEKAWTLRKESSEFRLAADALDAGQFVQNTALTFISLWGALEAIFSPSTTELRFRVSSLIASYLYPPGAQRLNEQKKIAALYDKRSAAAHGKPKHAGDDLLATFELLRKVLIRIIRDGKVPSREELDDCLFGARSGR